VARRNAAQVEIRRDYIKSTQIPKAFDGYRMLQLSDLHVEMSEDAIVCSSTLLQEIDYDVCVLTGDYRAQAFGPHEAALAGMSQLCAKLKQPIYGVLGNHDTGRMLPGLERMGIRMLLNECETINKPR
jgi:predicted MPP superfamily phosphohydrolase